MQKVVTVYLSNGENGIRLVNEDLKAGWKVVNMQPFSQNLCPSEIKNRPGSAFFEPTYRSGDYGVIFVLEKSKE